MTPLEFIVGGLATWRLSRAIVRENGPLMIFARLRAFLARRQKHMGGLFDAVSCVLCISFWIGLVASIWLAEGVFNIILYAISFSGVATLIHTVTSTRK